MSGIKGLKKGDRPDVEKDAENFIKGASKRSANTESQKQRKKQVYQRYTFSLTKEVSDDIDKLTLAPRDFRINRSQVVKAGIEVLKGLSETQLVKALKQVK